MGFVVKNLVYNLSYTMKIALRRKVSLLISHFFSFPSSSSLLPLPFTAAASSSNLF
jgi:hypothetical protein